tara:strand:+ start:2384 stop:2845 length:462 start_codon:yes stop_codon:yes gene_type:complete
MMNRQFLFHVAIAAFIAALPATAMAQSGDVFVMRQSIAKPKPPTPPVEQPAKLKACNAFQSARTIDQKQNILFFVSSGTAVSEADLSIARQACEAWSGDFVYCRVTNFSPAGCEANGIGLKEGEQCKVVSVGPEQTMRATPSNIAATARCTSI